jgi:uncharacterized Zn finger protein
MIRPECLTGAASAYAMGNRHTKKPTLIFGMRGLKKRLRKRLAHKRKELGAE